MSRFTAIVAQLENQDRWIEMEQRKLRHAIWTLERALEEVASDTEAKGVAWASERARRALAEAQEIDT